MLLCTFLILFYTVHSEVKELTLENFDNVINSKKIVFVNFFADWCPYCRQFGPVFKELDDNVAKSELADVVLLASVNGVTQRDLIFKFQIMRYPTLVIFKDGKISGNPYFGVRKIPNLMEHLRRAYPHISILKTEADINDQKFAVIAYDGDFSGQLFDDFSKIHQVYYENCQFYKVEKPRMQVNANELNVIFHTKSPFLIHDQYMYRAGDYQNFDEWVKSKCIPYVQEITFENAASITATATPLLIVMYSKDSAKLLSKVNQDLIELKSELTGYKPVFANAEQFNYVMTKVGKTEKDLPFVMIDDMMRVYYLGPVSILESKSNINKVFAAHKQGALTETNVFPQLYVEIISSDNGQNKEFKIKSNVELPVNEIIDRIVEISKKQRNDQIVHEEVVNAKQPVETERARKVEEAHNRVVESHAEETKPGGLLQSFFKNLMPDSGSFNMVNREEL